MHAARARGQARVIKKLLFLTPHYVLDNFLLNQIQIQLWEVNEHQKLQYK